jgi:hypothetical protein
MSDLLDNNNSRIDALDDELDALRQEFAQYRQEADWRLERLEKGVVGGLRAGTTLVSAEVSATGKMENPTQIDAQEILLRARAGDRKHMPVTTPGYGKRA